MLNNVLTVKFASRDDPIMPVKMVAYYSIVS